MSSIQETKAYLQDGIEHNQREITSHRQAQDGLQETSEAAGDAVESLDEAADAQGRLIGESATAMGRAREAVSHLEQAVVALGLMSVDYRSGLALARQSKRAMDTAADQTGNVTDKLDHTADGTVSAAATAAADSADEAALTYHQAMGQEPPVPAAQRHADEAVGQATAIDRLTGKASALHDITSHTAMELDDCVAAQSALSKKVGELAAGATALLEETNALLAEQLESGEKDLEMRAKIAEARDRSKKLAGQVQAAGEQTGQLIRDAGGVIEQAQAVYDRL